MHEQGRAGMEKWRSLEKTGSLDCGAEPGVKKEILETMKSFEIMKKKRSSLGSGGGIVCRFVFAKSIHILKPVLDRMKILKQAVKMIRNPDKC